MAETEEEKRIQGLVEFALMKQDIQYIKDKVSHIDDCLASDYVTTDQFKPVKDNFVSRAEFDPVRKIVYGLVAIVLSAVILAILTAVIVTKVVH